MTTENESSVIRIPLAHGKGVTLIDADYTPSSLKWRILRDVRTAYAGRTIYDGGTKCSVLLHREVMEHMLGRPLEPGEEVDHINGNGLDNRLENLRLATRSENNRNVRIPRTNTSGYKGVDWHKARQKWRAQIQVDGRNLHLGLFVDPVAAAHAYDEAALLHHGEFARLNFPIEIYE